MKCLTIDWSCDCCFLVGKEGSGKWVNICVRELHQSRSSNVHYIEIEYLRCRVIVMNYDIEGFDVTQCTCVEFGIDRCIDRCVNY